jgi:hypothetical protein
MMSEAASSLVMPGGSGAIATVSSNRSRSRSLKRSRLRMSSCLIGSESVKLKVLAMTFKTDGFLSPTMEEFRTSLRDVPAYKLWLEFAEELNRLGWDMLEDHETPTTDNQRLIISVLFIRAHQSFQAAITLVEKGMLVDARCPSSEFLGQRAG